MMRLQTWICLSLLVGSLAAQAAPEELPLRTALDDYVAQPDASYRWEVVASHTDDGLRTVVIDMVSQTWLTESQVDRTEWRHWLVVSIPEAVTSDVGMLFIGGGSNRGEAPKDPNERTSAIARATGTVVAELRMVPNQPLVFHDDGRKRVEDDLIGYTWDQFLKGAPPVWLARNPMIKSAVRAMDTMTAFMASQAGGEHAVGRFVVAGGSKRGWTTWLTGAIDQRVIGIVPIVIDVLNTDVSMRHHFAAYGYWAPSVGNYVEHGIMQQLDNPRLGELYRLVDPYYYRHRLTMPKLVLNAAGDQFFLPDSSQFYFDDLRGENYLRYVPNTDHGMGGSDAVETIIAFYSLLVRGVKPPQITWRHGDDGALRVMAHGDPQEARLWQATNPAARDFRVETFGRGYSSKVVERDADGMYVASVDQPAAGWTAYFMEFTFDVGAATPLKLSTDVHVIPDVLPFAGKAPDLAPSVTLACSVSSSGDEVARKVKDLIVKRDAAASGFKTLVRGERVYLNWASPAEFQANAGAIGDFLEELGCGAIAYQLESGPDITASLDQG